MEEKYITKRWFIYFLLYFLVSYVGMTFLITGFQITESGIFFVAIKIFHPIVALAAAYLYFRKARSDWPARFVTAIGWTAIYYVLVLALLEPVWGIAWIQGVAWDMIIPHWLYIIGIIVGATAAHRSDDEIAQIVKARLELKEDILKK